MDTRRAKQIIYGALYGLLGLGVIAIIYFWSSRPVPTCYDGMQNQGEQGVDCGGPCAAACIPANIHNIAPLGDVLVFNTGGGRATILAQVANANAGFAAKSFDYRFDLYDASNTIIQSVQGQSFLYDGEVKYLIAPNVETAGLVDRAALVIRNVQWAGTSHMGIVPQFVLQNNGPAPSPAGTVTVAGALKNNDLASFSGILVVAVFKSVQGDVIGASQTTLDGIAPDETENFAVMYLDVPGLDPSLTSFYAYAPRT